MIVDTSALVAMLRDEPSGAAVRDAMIAALDRLETIALSAASYVELGMVVDAARSPVQSRKVDEILVENLVHVVPVDAEQARVAREAYRDYGRGSGHPARLNYGDCFSYALASVRREPLLFVGEDFVHTDLRSVL